MTEPAKDRAAYLARDAVLAFTGLLGLVLLLRLIFVRFYNYDEISRVHMTWLVSVGEVPYRDFAANHFPFLWILASPLVRILPESPVALDVLRGLALLLNAVFAGALGVLICVEQPARQRVWAVACFGLVVLSPLAMQYLIEFRNDALANALLFSALAWLRLGRSKNAWSGFGSGLCIGVAILINTKYMLFPFFLGAIALMAYARQIGRIWPFALAIGMGFAAALLGGILLLVLMGVSLNDAWLMVVAYNAAVEKAHTFGFGLAHALTQNPVWLAYSLAGFAGCAVLFFRQRRLPELLVVAISIFLVVDLVTTTRPWRQYVIAWLLLAAYFPARSLPPLIARLGPRAQVAAAFCVLATVAGFAYRGIDDPNAAGLDRPTQDRVIEWASRRVPADGFVVASFFCHPVFRRDTFFKTVFDVAPGVDDGLEELMPRLAQPAYAEHFRQSGYEKELELRPPAMIVLRGKYTFAQAQALKTYLKRHPDDYDLQPIPGTTVTVLERKTEKPPN